MRALGKDPTDEEIVNIIKEVDRSGTGCLNFNDFLTFLAYIFQVSLFNLNYWSAVVGSACSGSFPQVVIN